ncbi:TrmH family RNA methyltransferase [Aurantivibrio infirmus]
MDHIQKNHEQHKPTKNLSPLVFLAHDFTTPENVGSLFRIADALGIEKIYLSGSSPCPPNKKIKKTSRSSEKYVAYSYHQDPLAIIEELKNQAYQIVCLEITDKSIDVAELEVNSSSKVCLVLGSEKNGISKPLLDMSDSVVHIPMLGANSSMNVANACSIASYVILQKYKALL